MTSEKPRLFSPIHLSLCVCLLFAVNGRSAIGSDPLDFQNDIIPVLTKSGCNAGACHGAAIGRGGFKLSLYGGNPTSDYDAIVRQIGGRRVNLADEERSLIVLKPTEEVQHGGGSVIDFDSESAKLLMTWIQQGATNHSARQLERVEVSPQRHISKATNEPVPLQAIAHYSDGSRRDVTKVDDLLLPKTRPPWK